MARQTRLQGSALQVLAPLNGEEERSVEGELFVSVNGSFVMGFPDADAGLDTLEWQNCHFAHQ